MLLAIDTSAGTSVAIVDRDAGVLAERSSADTRRHAELIGTFIADCFAESGTAIAALSGVVAGMGPGPYTGLRVGIAAARAFALGAGKRVVAVVSHDAIAFEAYASGDPGPLLVATDARRREAAWSTFSGADAAGLPLRAAGPHLAPAAELREHVPHFDTYRLIEARTVSAAALGMLAETMYVNRRPFAADEAIYLRAPDVTLSSGPKRVTS
jgi:tRNA threonylcarbamoyl adenosine modification protein YeaZ